MKPLLTALLAVALSSPACAAPEQIDLVPSGKWRVDYAENGCVLSRSFTGAGKEYKLGLTFEPVSADVWMRLRGPDSVSHFDSGEIKTEIDGAPQKTLVHFNLFKDKSGGATREYWLRDFRNNVAGTQRTIRLQTGKYGDIRIGFDGFAEAMKSIETCVDDLHRSLGIDPALLKTIASEPDQTSMGALTLPDIGDEFVYQMLYWVTASGRVDECHLLAPTRDAAFNKNACDEMKMNARFKPARDTAGKPVRAPVYENAHVRRVVYRSEN